jgi:putative PIN family toxin of toxin-antitoxin system
MIYAVIDTNVLVSALFTHNAESATVKVVEAMLCGVIVPLLDNEIIEEYIDVLNRPKFNFSKKLIRQFIETIRQKGVMTRRVQSQEHFTDLKDVIFYEIALSKENAYLVTGNTKHFPETPIVVTPAEMVRIIGDI